MSFCITKSALEKISISLKIEWFGLGFFLKVDLMYLFSHRFKRVKGRLRSKVSRIKMFSWSTCPWKTLCDFAGTCVHIYKEKKPHASRNLNVKHFPWFVYASAYFTMMLTSGILTLLTCLVYGILFPFFLEITRMH